jgi:hypothetical protein
MRHFPIAAAFVLIVVGTAVGLRADGERAEPAGVWKWVTDPTAESIEINELTLKQDGDKLIGSLFRYNSHFPKLAKSAQAQIRRNTTLRISDGTIQDGRISFRIVRSFNGRKSVTTYTGEIDGNRIKGEIQYGRESREWEAKRANR